MCWCRGVRPCMHTPRSGSLLRGLELRPSPARTRPRRRTHQPTHPAHSIHPSVVVWDLKKQRPVISFKDPSG